MKLKIIHTLPIALAVILPGMSFYAGHEDVISGNVGLLEKWLGSSLILYVIWYFLWYIRSPNYKLRILALLSFVFFMVKIIFITIHLSGSSFQWSLIIRFAFATSLILIVQYAVKAQQNISRLLLEKEQIQTENYKEQLKALRNKIDPHFLFNSLNTLRSMVRHHHVNAERFIMSLSDFYRQTLKHNENTTLQLSEELQVLESYLFLMKSRNVEAIRVNLKVDESVDQFHIPTLALQGVVENCFKHNSMTSRMPLHIKIHSTDDFYIVISNNIQPKIGYQKSSGLGLDLLRKRYALMNIKQGVIIQKTKDQFSVKLKLI